jgi:YVTN family beta-propeller protein
MHEERPVMSDQIASHAVTVRSSSGASLHQMFVDALKALLGLALLLALPLTPSLWAQGVVATLEVGPGPKAIAVNPVTNKIYVANSVGNSVTVIDGITGKTATVAAGLSPVAIAVNAATNKIYVANAGSNNVTVIDGATDSTATVEAGSAPSAIAVNPETNKIYVTNLSGNTVTEIDGSTHVTATIEVGSNPYSIALNPVTNKAYVANSGSASITVIDEVSRSTTHLPVGTRPTAVAVDTTTGEVYVANSGSGNVTVIDGTTHSTSTIAAGIGPYALAVDAARHKVYVANYLSANVTVIDAASHSTSTIEVGAAPTAIVANTTKNKIYVANANSNNATVIDGATNTKATVAADASPSAVAVNPVTGRVYVANYRSHTVTVLDASGTSTTAAVAQSQLTQTITFADLPSLNLILFPVQLSATASSGLPVSFRVVSGSGVVVGSFLIAIAPGTIVVEADQAGNSSYLPAMPVLKSAIFVQAVLLTRNIIHFGTGPVGAVTGNISVSILNFTTSAVSLGLIPSGSTDFKLLSSNCGAKLAADRSCSLNIGFSPQTPGFKSTTIAITATGGFVLPLTMDGTGGTPLPFLFRNVITGAFSGQGLGLTSAAEYDDLSNFTGKTISLSGIAPVGDFGVTNNSCGATLANNSKCSFYVTFTPTALGPRSATMNIVAGGTPLPLALAGTGLPDGTSLFSSTAVWGTQGLGMTATGELFNEVRNFSGSTVALSGFTAAGDFAVAKNECGATLANNSRCSFYVSFTPTALGPRSATMNIVAGNTVLPLALTGVGAPNIVSLFRSDITHAYNKQGLFQTSAPEYDDVSNFTPEAVSLSGIGPVGDYRVTNNSCGPVLASNAKCYFYVTFTPTVLGLRNSTMNIIAGSNSLPLALSGTGVSSVSVLFNNSMLWGGQKIGQATPNPQYNDVSNFTGSTVTLSGIGDVGDFSVSGNTCGATLANNTRCYFYVTFTPTATGVRSATMNIVAGSATLPLNLTGVGN